MDEEVAKLIVIALTAIGAVVWLTALAFTLRARRERQAADVGGALPFDVDTAQALPPSWDRGGRRRARRARGQAHGTVSTRRSDADRIGQDLEE